jgi:hypothetical protein
MIRANGCEYLCNYIFMTHQRRGCDPGPGCKRYVSSKMKRAKLRKASWDTEAGKKLWGKGWKDRQIGEKLGVRVETVGCYRRRVWEKEENHGKAD